MPSENPPWQSGFSRCGRCGKRYCNDGMYDGEVDGRELYCRCAAIISRTGVQSYYIKPPWDVHPG